jgi:hypothetical protein
MRAVWAARSSFARTKATEIIQNKNLMKSSAEIATAILPRAKRADDRGVA